MNMRQLLLTLFAICCFSVAAGCSAPTGPVPNGELTAKVKRVVDGDTFQLEDGHKVRLIGVNTPESVKPNHPIEPYAKEASAYTKKMLEGQTVTLRFDVEPLDKYSRWLAYVYMPDGTFYNEILVRQGYAQVMTIQPNVKYQKIFLEAQRDARSHKRGLWGLKKKDSPRKNKELAD